MNIPELHVETLGTRGAPAVLFLHGMAGSGASWQPAFHPLSDQFELHFVDLLGFGASPKPEIEYSLDQHLAALHEVARRSPGPVSIVGHSMGALLGLAYCARHPEKVQRYVGVATPWYRSAEEARAGVARSSLFNRWLALDTPLAHAACFAMCLLRPALMPLMPSLLRNVPAAVARDSLKHSWHSYSRSLRHVLIEARPGNWLASAQAKMLFVHGRRDSVAPIANLARALQGSPRAVLVEIDAGHDLVFTHAAELSALIRRHLS